MIEPPSLIPAEPVTAITLIELAVNLLLAGALAFGVGLHYRTFGATLASREAFTRVFPFVALTTCLIISIIKSSLAMSIGLIGALSIVRFRTPVKEPEELAYIFLSITLGIGMGAGLRRETTLAVALILGVVTLIQLRSKRISTRNLYVNIGLDPAEGSTGASVVEPVNGVLTRHCRAIDLRRMDTGHRHVELTYFIEVTEVGAVARLAEELERQYPTVRVTLLDQGRMPSL